MFTVFPFRLRTSSATILIVLAWIVISPVASIEISVFAPILIVAGVEIDISPLELEMEMVVFALIAILPAVAAAEKSVGLLSAMLSFPFSSFINI